MDREKVITHLDDMRLFADTRVHSIVSPENWGIYSDLCDFIDLIKEEVLDLLKEQEAVEPINSYGTFRCGNCRNIVGYNDGHGRGYQNNFCSKCGRPVLLEGGEMNA